MKKTINKIMSFKIPEEWHHPDSFFFNFMNLIFWAIVTGIILIFLAKWG